MQVAAGQDLKCLTQSELATAYRHWRDVTPLEMREFYDAIQAAPVGTFIHLQGSVQARDVDDDATDDGEADAVEQYYIAMLERRAKKVQELKENIPLPVKTSLGSAIRENGGRVLQNSKSAFNRPDDIISDLHDGSLQRKLHQTQTTYITDRIGGASFPTSVIEEVPPLRRLNRSQSIDDIPARQGSAFPIQSTPQTRECPEMCNGFPSSSNIPMSTAFISTTPLCNYEMAEMVDLTEGGPFYSSDQQPRVTDNDDRMANVSEWMNSLPTFMGDCEPISVVATSVPVCSLEQQAVCAPIVKLEPIQIVPPSQPYSLPPFPQFSQYPSGGMTTVYDEPSYTQSSFQSTSFQPQLFQPSHIETAIPPIQYGTFGPPPFTLQQPPVAQVTSQFETALAPLAWSSIDQFYPTQVESYKPHIPVQAQPLPAIVFSTESYRPHISIPQQLSTIVSTIPLPLPPVPSHSAPLDLDASCHSLPPPPPPLPPLNTTLSSASETPIEATTSQSPWWETFTFPSKEDCTQGMERSVRCHEAPPAREGLKRKRSSSPTLDSSPSTPVKATLATVSLGTVDANLQPLYTVRQMGDMDEVEQNLQYRVNYERRYERSLKEKLVHQEAATRSRKKPKRAKRADTAGATQIVRQKDCDRKYYPMKKAVRQKKARIPNELSPSRFLTCSRREGDSSFSSC